MSKQSEKTAEHRCELRVLGTQCSLLFGHMGPCVAINNVMTLTQPSTTKAELSLPLTYDQVGKENAEKGELYAAQLIGKGYPKESRDSVATLSAIVFAIDEKLAVTTEALRDLLDAARYIREFPYAPKAHGCLNSVFAKADAILAPHKDAEVAR